MPGTGPPPSSPEHEGQDRKKEHTSEASRSKWFIYTSKSNEPDGPFDAIVATTGTCGEPIRVEFEGMDDFIKSGGRVVHSSELDTLGAKDEKDNDSASDSREGPDPNSNGDMTEAQPEAGVSYADKVKNADEHDTDGVQSPGNGNKGEEHQTRPLDVKGKTVAIVGSGASGVEAAEWAIEKGASKVYLLARCEAFSTG